jgi:uncharacterized protein YecT (DUF1311 family)
MAHVLSQTNQPQHPQPQHPYSHPSYQHYPPPTYPYPPPPPPHHGPTWYYPQQPPVYAPYPPRGQHVPPPQSPHSATEPPRTDPSPAQQELTIALENPTTNNHNTRYQLSEDDDTQLVRIALRWIFVREQAASPATFWTDVTRSFEKAINRKFASAKRKISTLEEQWRAKFAARDAQGGLQGNNNTELARAMRAWIAFRDEEERAKKEKEEDQKALDVRRERLHELESERLGLTDVCRYETTVIGEEEEVGPQGVDTGDRANPISLEDAANEEPQQSRPADSLYRDLEPTESNSKSRTSDPVAPIVELLRKRQREEREEADIRREEQVLLNKRLAMMEEQVQMLSKLITQREEKSQPAQPPQSTVIDLDGDSNESTAVPTRPSADAGAVDASNKTEAPVENTEVSPDVPMPDVPANTTSGSETATADTSKINDAPNETAEYSPNVSMNESADVPDETPADSGTEKPDDTVEAQIDANDSPGTIDASPAAEVEAEPKDTGAVQATESANEDSPATSISEEE